MKSPTPTDRSIAVPPSTTVSTPSPASHPGVTLRSLLIGAVLIPINAYWIIQMERVRYSAHPTTLSLFFNTVFILFVLTFLNWGLYRIAPRFALRRAELLVIYVMLGIASTMAAHDAMQVLVPMLSWPYRFARPENRWQELFIPYLPKWLMMSDKEAMRGYYEGNSTLYTAQHLHAWVMPVVWWTFFCSLLLWIMLCINSILRKQWTEHERLTYPLVQLPLEMTADEGIPGKLSPLFKNRLFWIAFVLAGAMDAINSLNLYFPYIPTVLTPGQGQSFIDLGPNFRDRPFNAIGWTPLSWYPFVVGIGMLMPLDFLFSLWFFYWLWKAELVVVSAFSWDQTPQFPYQNYQAFGAYMAFLVSAVWLSRGYLKEVYRKVVGLSSSLDDSEEPITYRNAALGILIGFVLLEIFCLSMGMSWWLAILFFVIFFGLSIAITRMRAELGTPIHDLHFTGPDWTLPELFGTRNFGARDLTQMTLFFWFNRAYRYHPMPHQLEGFKIAERTGSSYKRYFGAMMLAGAFGAVAGFWAMLHLNYIYGATAKAGTFGPEGYDRLTSWLNSPNQPAYLKAGAIGVGFGIAFLLEAMRLRFPAWPFHPLGFAVTASWEINLVWMPLFIAWVCKSLLLRYGGLQSFRNSLPFFFGLMLGQFFVGSIVNIIGIAMEIPTYQFWQ
jgi:hypothetical protein